MKTINSPVVLLLTIMGLASGFLLLQKPMQSPPVASGEILNQVPVTADRFSETSIPASDVQSENTASGTEADSETTSTDLNSQQFRYSTATFPDAGQEMTFCVTGLKAKTSSIYVAVFESEDGFPKSERSSGTTVVSGTDDQVRFSLRIPRNQPVAIAVFQDIDGNGKLSKNSIGIPTEPYGFSNNARGLFGPPSFAQAAFAIHDDTKIADPIEIKVH